MDARILGSGGWMPAERRETACVLVRDGAAALLLDAGSGLRRLVGDPGQLDGAERLDIVLTHFHLDHVCGLGYVPALPLRPTIWAPGRWLYHRQSADILAPLRGAPLSPFEEERLGPVRELDPGEQAIGAFTVVARAQQRHWDPTAGLRIGDALARLTDTAYDPDSAPFALGVSHLLHEAWSTTASPASTEGDATAAQAGCVAKEAGARRLTLIHLRPPEPDEDALLADARDRFPAAAVGRDGMALMVD